MKVLVGKYLTGKYSIPESEILSSERLSISCGLPAMKFSHDNSGLARPKHFEELSYDKQQYRNKKILLLGRDIKDTLVSSYFHTTKRRFVFEDPISDFIRSDNFGISKLVTFYDTWLQNQQTPKSFIFLRYEDLHQNTADVLRKVLGFIGEDHIEEDLLNTSIEYGSFNNLKIMEAEHKFEEFQLQPGNILDPESFKVRKGEIGGYIKYLSKDDITFIDNKIKEHSIDFNNFI